MTTSTLPFLAHNAGDAFVGGFLAKLSHNLLIIIITIN